MEPSADLLNTIRQNVQNNMSNNGDISILGMGDGLVGGYGYGDGLVGGAISSSELAKGIDKLRQLHEVIKAMPASVQKKEYMKIYKAQLKEFNTLLKHFGIVQPRKKRAAAKKKAPVKRKAAPRKRAAPKKKKAAPKRKVAAKNPVRARNKKIAMKLKSLCKLFK